MTIRQPPASLIVIPTGLGIVRAHTVTQTCKLARTKLIKTIGYTENVVSSDHLTKVSQVGIFLTILLPQYSPTHHLIMEYMSLMSDLNYCH